MANPIFTDQDLSEIESLDDAQFDTLWNSLSPEEQGALEAATSAPKPATSAPTPTPEQPALVGVPTLLSLSGPGTPRWPEQNLPEPQSLKQEITEGLSDISWGPKDLIPGPWQAISVGQAGAAILNPLKRKYLDPLIKRGQDAMRADLLQGADPQKLKEFEQQHPALTHGARLVGSALYGSPSRYVPPEDLERGQRALAQEALNVTRGLEGLTDRVLGTQTAPQENVPYPEQTTIGAFANLGLEESAYLPLYLMPGAGSSGAVKGATGAFAGDLLDTRPTANPIMSGMFGTAVGGALGDVAPVIAKEVKALIKSKKFGAPGTIEIPGPKDAPMAVVPAEDVRALVDHPPTAGELKAGGKVSYYEARATPAGDVEMRPVQISAEGKKVGQPLGATTPGRRGVPVVADTPEVASKLSADGVDAISPIKREIVTAPVDVGDVVAKEGEQYRLLFGEDEVTLLHDLPQGDFLVARVPAQAPGGVSFHEVKVRNLELESLRRREPVMVNTPEGQRFGFLRVDEDGMALIVPPMAEESIPKAISQAMTIESSKVKAITSTKELNEVLDARRAFIEQQQDLRLSRQDAAVAQEAAAAGVPVVETPQGPKIPLTGADVPAASIPPSPPPPGFPPNGSGGNFGGVPLPPQPPPPGWFQTLSEEANLFQRMASPLFIPPTVTGPLDGSAAAVFAASSQAAEAVSSQVQAASRKVLNPVLDAMPVPRRQVVEANIVDFVEGRKSLEALQDNAPELVGKLDDLAIAAQNRLLRGQEFLQQMGFVEPRELRTPGGGRGMEEFVKFVYTSRAQLAQPFFAQELKSGAWLKYLQKHESEFKKVADQYVNEVLIPKGGLQNSSRQELVEIAKRKIVDFLRDPATLAHEIKQSDKLSAGLDDALEVWSQRSKALTIAQQDIATQFIQGDATVEQLANRFAGADGAKDIKFLQDLKAKYTGQMPGWARAALGPIDDPSARIGLSVSRQEELVMKAMAIKQLEEAGAIQDLVALQARPSAVKSWVKIPDDPTAYGRAAGKYVHPDYAGFLYYEETSKAFSGWLDKLIAPLRSINTAFKISNTVFSQGAWLSNVMGNINGLVMSGVLSPSDMFIRGRVTAFADAVSHWRDYVKSPLKGDVGSGAYWVTEARRHGVVGSDFAHAEFKQFLDKAAKAKFPEGKEAGSLLDYLNIFQDVMKSNAGKALKFYGGIDPYFKHANWLAGLKRGGVDIKTGTLADRKAAESFLVGWGGDPQSFARMSDEQMVERVKSGAARMIAESHPQPDRLAQIPKFAGSASDVLGPTGAFAMFARTASEVVRTNAMLPYRIAAGRPGVAKSMFEWSLLAGSVLGASYAMRAKAGVDPKAEQLSWAGLPAAIRKWRPGSYALPFKDDQGRVVYIDLGRLFDVLKYAAGDPGGRSLVEGLEQTPGQVAVRTAANMASAYAGLGYASQDVINENLARAGLLPQSTQPQIVQPGAAAFADHIWKLAAPGFAKQAVNSANLAAGQAGVPGNPVGAAMQFGSGGLFFMGGTPEQGSLNMMRDIQKAQREFMTTDKRTPGAPIGPFQKYDPEQPAREKTQKFEQALKRSEIKK